MLPQITLPGARVRAAHVSAVTAILGTKVVPVTSKGGSFYTTGWFPILRLIGEVYGNVYKSGGPPLDYIHPPAIPPTIIIAETPDEVPPATFAALNGGASHEAFHQLWTRQGALTPAELQDARGKLTAFRAAYARFKGPTVGRTVNLFEDVFIERGGRLEFPGTIGGLEALSDFIIAQEGRIMAPGAAAMVYIRELGFGYDTEANHRRLDQIRLDFPHVATLVEKRFGGMIADLIAFGNDPRSIARLHGGDSLNLALDFLKGIEKLVDDADMPPPARGPGPKGPDDPKAGAGEKAPAGEGEPSPGKGEGEPKPGEGKKGEPGKGAGESDPKPGEGDGEAKPGTGNGEGESKKPPTKGRRGAGGRDLGLDQVKSSNEALALGIEEYKAHSPQAWRPQSTSDDKIVTHRTGTFVPDPAYAAAASSLRSFFLRKFRARVEMDTERGLRHGPTLSARNLVDTVTSLRGGFEPTRAFDRVDQAPDITVAAAIIVDQSGSMQGHVPGMASMAHVLMDIITKIGGKTMVAGFSAESHGGNASFHRLRPVHYHVYKTWEQTATVGARSLGGMTARGTTPTADGVQFGITALRARREKKKVMFVITDGAPNPYHAQVIASQVAATPYPIVGVGIGDGADRVRSLFPLGAYGDDTKELMKDLIRLLDKVL